MANPKNNRLFSAQLAIYSPLALIDMQSKIILIILLNIILVGCKFDDTFDENLLEDFKIFQKTIEEQPDETFEKTDNYRWIVESNFNRLFSFTDKSFKDRFTNLFNEKEITRIEINDKKCIQFRIIPFLL